VNKFLYICGKQVADMGLLEGIVAVRFSLLCRELGEKLRVVVDVG